jgi:hypothetical protein
MPEAPPTPPSYATAAAAAVGGALVACRCPPPPMSPSWVWRCLSCPRCRACWHPLRATPRTLRGSWHPLVGRPSCVSAGHRVCLGDLRGRLWGTPVCGPNKACPCSVLGTRAAAPVHPAPPQFCLPPLLSKLLIRADRPPLPPPLPSPSPIPTPSRGCRVCGTMAPRVLCPWIYRRWPLCTSPPPPFCVHYLPSTHHVGLEGS